MSSSKETKHELREFFLSLSKNEREVFASKCGTTAGHIKHIYSGNRNCNESVAIMIDKHSGGVVRCDDLCLHTDFNYVRSTRVSK